MRSAEIEERPFQAVKPSPCLRLCLHEDHWKMGLPGFSMSAGSVDCRNLILLILTGISGWICFSSFLKKKGLIPMIPKLIPMISVRKWYPSSESNPWESVYRASWAEKKCRSPFSPSAGALPLNHATLLQIDHQSLNGYDGDLHFF